MLLNFGLLWKIRLLSAHVFANEKIKTGNPDTNFENILSRSEISLN